MIVSRLLMLVAALLFLLGAYFPAAILVESEPSIHVYGLMLVSIPVWILGASCAGIAVWLVARRSRGFKSRTWLAWVLLALNLSALLGCLIWQPEGVS